MQCAVDAGLDSHLDKPEGKNIIEKLGNMNWAKHSLKELFILIVMTLLATRENSHVYKMHTIFSNRLKLQNKIPNKNPTNAEPTERSHRGRRPRLKMTKDK